MCFLVKQPLTTSPFFQVEVGDTNEDLKNKIAEMEAYEHAANQDPIFEEDEDDLAGIKTVTRISIGPFRYFPHSTNKDSPKREL